MIKTRWVNPFVLKEMRHRLNLTPEQVEAESKKLIKCHYAFISAQDLRQWEEGIREPELEHLETLSEIYLCPVGYFFLDKTPEESLPLSLRGLAEDKVESLSSDTRKSLRRFYELAQYTVKLIEQLGIPWKTKLRPDEFPPHLSYVNQIVQKKREYFGWTEETRFRFKGEAKEAFLWWRKAIENEGVFCFEMKLEPQEIRGASLWIMPRYSFILVNQQDAEASTGRLFTLLHEYAHLITQEEGIVCDFRGHRESKETFSNRFAARMLLSPGELLQRLKELGLDRPRENWSDQLLDSIRKPFLVSRDVIAIMLQEIGLAPKDFYDRKRRQWEERKPWGRGGKRLTKNESKFLEIGYSLANLLINYKDNPSFPWLEVSNMLDMKVEKVNKFIQWISETMP